MSKYLHLTFSLRMNIGEIRKMARGINSITSDIIESGEFSGRDIEALHLRICCMNSQFQDVLESESWAVRNDIDDIPEEDDEEEQGTDGECPY